MRESMTRGEWWDDSAPYGTNGFQYRKGERITGMVIAREIAFAMMPGDPNCAARGVAETTDGRVYMFTVLRPEFARERREAGERTGRKHTRFASLSRQSFADTAHGLLTWEEAGHRIAPDDVARYRREIDAL